MAMGHTGTEIEGQVVAFICENFAVDSVDKAVSLVEARIVDSAGIIEIVSWVEERYGVAIGDEEITDANFGSVDGIVAFLMKKLPQD